MKITDTGGRPVLTRHAEAETCAGMGRLDYLRLLGRVMRGEADAKEIAASAERYDNHYVDSPA